MHADATHAEDLVELAAQAFIYGFPLVFDLAEVERFTEHGMASLAKTPLNVFGHATELAGPQDTFVSINNDTIYSIAQVDAGGGPVRLHVPDADGRYYVLQFVDAWTNNFAYVGHRATGTAAGTYLLVGPGWNGDPADGERVIRLPTAVVSVVGRWAVDGEDDLPAVRALQAGLTLEATGAAGQGLPGPADGVPEELRFFEQLRVWSRAFPPAPRDLAFQQRLAPLGLTDEASPYVDVDLALGARAGLWGNHGYEAAYAMVYDDADGVPLDGTKRYRLTFATPPPVGAFWSVTMYDLPQFFLVDNPIDRYSIGDRTPDLAYGEDGSLTIVLQAEEPAAPHERANWLPTPDGPFRPILRMYEPKPAVFDGSYVLPPITPA